MRPIITIIIVVFLHLCDTRFRRLSQVHGPSGLQPDPGTSATRAGLTGHQVGSPLQTVDHTSSITCRYLTGVITLLCDRSMNNVSKSITQQYVRGDLGDLCCLNALKS